MLATLAVLLTRAIADGAILVDPGSRIAEVTIGPAQAGAAGADVAVIFMIVDKVRALEAAINCVVQLDEYALPYGGERWYALCSRTGRRCTALVLPPSQVQFASVSGWNVAYGSQRECRIHRGHRAINKARTRLKALSKYTPKPTRERLVDRLIGRQVFVEDQLDRIASMIW